MYIGDLGNDATRYELEDAFTPFGAVKNVWIAKRPPGNVNIRGITLSDYNNVRICLCVDGRPQRRS